MTAGTWRRNAASSKQASSRLSGQQPGDRRVGGQQVAQRAPLVGRPERRSLDDRVGLLARQAALLDERHEDAAARRGARGPRSMFSRIRSGRTTSPSTRPVIRTSM